MIRIKPRIISNKGCLVSMLIMAFVATACNNRSLNGRSDGEVIESIASHIVSFDSDSVTVGSWSDIMSAGDWIFIIDSSSSDSIVTVLDADDLKLRGRIAQLGPGPAEITIPGACVYDDKTGRIMMFDYGQLKVKSFKVDSALSVDNYVPYVVMDIPTGRFPDRYIHVNDTLGFARLITMPDKQSRHRGHKQTLCRYNMLTGEIDEFCDTTRMEGLRTYLGLNVPNKLLVECAINNDLITLYDFDGKKLREIRGPEYLDDAPAKEKVFFSRPVVTDDYIFAPYSGSEDRETSVYGRYIQVYDIDGNYIKTLDPGKLIGHIEYDSKRNRLLIVFNDPDIQLGYVDTKDIL